MKKEKEYKTIIKAKQEYRVPYATDEEVAYIEKTIIEDCKPFLGKISIMDDETFENFLNEKAMRFDVHRGLIPSQIPHIIFRHTPEFEQFEEQLWKEINEYLLKYSL